MRGILRLRKAHDRNHRQLLRAENAWSTARFCVFLVTSIGTLFFSLKSDRFGALAAWISFCTGTALFVFLVGCHRRTLQLLCKYDALDSLIRRAEARRDLRWDEVPDTPSLDSGASPRYFWDLDLVSEPATRILSAPSLLRLIDCTSSPGGWSKLVARFGPMSLSTSELDRRQKTVEELSALPGLRLRFLLTSKLAGSLQTQALDHLLETTVFPPSAWDWLWAMGFLQLTVASAATVLDAKWAWGYLPVFVVYRWMQSRLEPVERAFDLALSLERELGRLYTVLGELERWKPKPASELARLLETLHHTRSGIPSRRIRSLERVLAFLSVRGNTVIHLALNLILPWDLFWASRLEKLKVDIRSDLPIWLETLAEIETTISLAEFNDLQESSCRPEWTDSREGPFLSAEDLGHPMISGKKRVGNPALLDSAHVCILITGSNMSGKSTYLRTLGVGVLLAKAGARVPAKRFRLMNCDLRTCLRITDSLTDQISSFYAEVRELKEILENAEAASSDPGRPGFLYLIDEIFRGTNNRERLLGSRAYIEHILSLKRAAGLIASHDLELAELATTYASLSNLHFRETIEDGMMHFDYRVASGPSPSTNALRIMELAGLPVPRKD